MRIHGANGERHAKAKLSEQRRSDRTHAANWAAENRNATRAGNYYGVGGMWNVRVGRAGISRAVKRTDRAVRRESGASGETDRNASACGGYHFGFVPYPSGGGGGEDREIRGREEDRQE